MSLLCHIGTVLRMHARLDPSFLYPRCFRTTWCSWANCCGQVTIFPA